MSEVLIDHALYGFVFKGQVGMLIACARPHCQYRSGASFDVRPAEMAKEVPGGIFSMFYNSLNLGKYSKSA